MIPFARVRLRRFDVRLSTYLMAVIAALWSAPTALAQPAAPESLARLAGAIVDPAGAAVPDARLVLRGPLGTVAETRSDEAGQFAFDAVPPGRYGLVTSRAGFRADPLEIVLDAGERRTLQVALRISAVAESLVVSASQVDVPLSQVPGSVSMYSRQELQARQIDTVADALRLVPGLTVAGTGGPGAVTSVFPRGGESDYTLVLVDGIRQNTFGGGFDFAHLATFDVASLEVVRGPQSAVFGSDAIGGVVQIRTRLGGAPTATGALEAGSFGGSRLSAGTSGSAGPWSWGAGVERASSDGWTGIAPATGERVSNDDYRALGASVGLAWKPSARSSVRADARLGTNERGYPGPFGTNPIGAYVAVDRVSRGTNDSDQFSLSVSHDWSSRTGLRVQATYGDLRSGFVSPYGDSDSRSRRASIRAQVDRVVRQSLTSTAGVEVMAERADSSVILGASGPIPISRLAAGYFAEVRYQPGPRLFATAGLRLEQIHRRAIEADPAGWTPRPELPAGTVLSLNPRVGASYYLRTSDATGGNWTRVHGSAGTGIRAPDGFELAFTDNPHLAPERSRSADAGLEQALAGGRLVIDATAFVNRYDDLIVAVGRALQDYSQFRTDNISNARAAGLESSAAFRTTWGLDARIAYTFLDTAVLAVDRSPDVVPAPFTAGDPLIRRPRHQASLDVVVIRGPVTTYARVGGRSRTLDVEPSYGASGGLFYAPGFASADAGTSIRVARDISVIARVTNLFDRHYEDVLGYPVPGRTFTVGVRLAAGR